MLNKRGFILPASIFLVLFLTIILSLSFFRSNIELGLADRRRASALAFYAAETGIERSIFMLRQSGTWREGFIEQALHWPEPNGELVATYSVQVEDGPLFQNSPTVWLRSEGYDFEHVTPRVIFARVLVEDPARFFMSTLGDLTIGSGANISGNILGRDIIFEVNHSLSEEERRITLEKDVDYLRNFILKGEDRDYVSIAGEINLVNPIIFVGVDLNYYTGLAQQAGRYIDGDFTYPATGDNTINRENLETTNGLVVATGDIHISGRLAESVLFVAGGNIYIDSDITCENAAQIGLFSSRDIIIPEDAPNNLTFEHALLIAEGNLVAEGERGSKAELIFNGAAAIRGREGERTVVDLNVYNTRNYEYNEELLTNRTIPFVPFIAALLHWQEHSPADVFPPQ